MVSLPYVGCVAFDVKAKTVYGGTTLYFDASEVQRLATFADLFNIATFFACQRRGRLLGP
jgi:Holliday junction resolvase